MVSGQGVSELSTEDAFYNGFEDATDGTKWGFSGFPHTFLELLKEKKPNMKFEVMNFGGADYGVKGSFFDSCDY